MKIAICVNGRPHEGGVTSFINTVSEGFRNLGHDVDIVTIFGISAYRNVNEDFVSFTDRLLKYSNMRTLIVYNISKIVMLVNIFIANMKNNYDVLFAIDVSVVQSVKYYSYFKKIPIYLNVQSCVANNLVNQSKITHNSYVYDYFIKEEVKAYRFANGIIANSKYTENYIKSLVSKHAPMITVRNAIDKNIFNNYRASGEVDILKTKYKIPNENWVIMFAGRLVEQKGIKYLLLAFRDYLKKEPQSTLILVGSEENSENYYRELKDMIKKYDLCKNIYLLGSVANKEMGVIIRMADTLVVPSIKHKGLDEALGIIALEGMASGVPVIVSNNGGLKEIIKDSVNGLIVPEKDHESITSALIKIKNNPQFKNRLIENGITEISEKYTSNVVAEKIIKFFKINND